MYRFNITLKYNYVIMVTYKTKEVSYMSNVLMIIAQDQFRDEELFAPKEQLEKDGHTVKVASRKVAECKGKNGKTAMPDIALDDVDIKDYDAIVFVGGSGSKDYFDDENIHKMVREADKEGKILGAICVAPTIFANAKIIFGKKVTAYPSSATDVSRKGAFFVEDEDVVQDGNIVTANGPAAAAEFGEKISKMLAGEDGEEE